MASVNLNNQQIQQIQQDVIDPITKFKLLIPRLKDSLQKMMNQAAHVLNQNALMDSCTVRSADVQVQKFDKSLEDFYAICDQIEINLRLAIEVVSQNLDAQRHTPMPVQPQAAQQNPDAIPYQHYINQIRLQLASARELHDLLIDCARKITEKPVQLPSS